jgi:hypothetical protein
MLVKDELLEKVLVRVREQLSEDQAPQVEEFVRQYYAWVAPEDLADRSAGCTTRATRWERRRSSGSLPLSASSTINTEQVR